MPIYEYTCSKCKHQFELLVRSMNDTSKPKCPQCGANADRALSVFAVGSESSTARSAVPMGGCCPCGNDGACEM